MSSLRGAWIAGKRACSAATIAAVSSTDSVVWVRKARLSGSATVEPGDVLIGLDQGHRAVGDLAEGADHLGMAGMADEQDVAARPRSAARPGGGPWRPAGRWRRRSRGRGRARRPGTDLGTPCAEKTTGRSSGHLVELVDEHRAQVAQPVDDEAVVDDLVADIDRRAEPLERQLDDLDGAVDAGAEAARRRDQDAQGEGGCRHRRRCKRSLAALKGASYERRHCQPLAEGNPAL